MTEFGLKELYDVTLKATYPMQIGNYTFEIGEVVAAFDKITLANFNEIKNTATARGGWDNRGLVYWETTKEIQVTCVQGIFSQLQFALMTGGKLGMHLVQPETTIPIRETLESNEEGLILLTHQAIHNPFIYNKNGEKLTYTKINNQNYKIATPYQDVIVDYEYLYTSKYSTLTIGERVLSGFLRFEGKSRVKDDITGQTHTVILRIPKFKLMSDLSIRLGEDANPVVGHLTGVALPEGDRKNTKVMELFFLDDDIDSDM